MTEAARERNRANSREYYRKHREEISAKNRLKYWEFRQEELERKLKAQNRTTLEFYEDWNKQLQERLESDELKEWLRTAIQLTIDANNSKIQDIYEEISRKVDTSDRQTGVRSPMGQ